MRSSSFFEVNCLPPFRPAREKGRRIILLPDGNHRKHGRQDYGLGAENVVACAVHLARRGDMGTLLVCIASRWNVEKRPDAFFEALAARFAHLRAHIVERAALVAQGIRCHARGALEGLHAKGGARARLVEEVKAACEATRAVEQPRLNLEFWLDYTDDLAWEQDADLVVRTGAEEVAVVRPGLSLPPNVPCITTTTLWPDVLPEEIDRLVDSGFRARSASFAPGYGLTFVADLLCASPTSPIPAPFRLTLPVCAAPEEVLEQLRRIDFAMYTPGITVTYAPSETAEPLVFGPQDDAWCMFHLVPAAHWRHLSPDSFRAVLAPGQSDSSACVGVATGEAPLHLCPMNVEGMLRAIGDAAVFPAKYPPLRGADRSEAHSLANGSPWPATLLDLIRDEAEHPGPRVEEKLRAKGAGLHDAKPTSAELLEGISAKALAKALAEGLLLPDPTSRQSDRNYAWTGAFMMFRVPDETNPTGLAWEPAAELAIQCMLTLSAGDNGVFDRVFPGESSVEWRERLESAASYLGAITKGETSIEPPRGRGSRLVRVIAGQWLSILHRYAGANEALLRALRLALASHYQTNLDEYAPEPATLPLVRRLAMGGAPRREALREIEDRYAAHAPSPVAERIRAASLCHVTDPVRFAHQQRELSLLLRMVSTAPGMGIVVLFLVTALPIPAEFVTPRRLHLLVDLARLADCTFRLANDSASLDINTGEDRDRHKMSSLSILIPRGASASTRAEASQHAKSLGKEMLAWLKEHLAVALARLRAEWPSMAAKTERAMLLGQAIYARSHYASLTHDEMLRVIDEISHSARPNQTMPPVRTRRTRVRATAAPT